MIRVHFRLDLNKVRSELKDKVIVIQKKISMDLLTNIVIMTPVDTGRAKGNWFVSLVAPRLDFDWAKTDAGGASVISEGQAMVSKLQDYGAIYLTNNLPYIVALEKGHSKQAPPGAMVRLSLDRVAAGLR